jgi:hypothetical protein
MGSCLNPVSSSPIIHIGFPAQGLDPKSRSAEVSLRRSFQAHEQVRTKVLQSFTQAPELPYLLLHTSDSDDAFEDPHLKIAATQLLAR